jgi:hypothetical protein
VLRQVQEYLIDFYDIPEFMRNIIGTSRIINEKILEVYNRLPCKVMITNFSGASTSIISPAFFEE